MGHGAAAAEFPHPSAKPARRLHAILAAALLLVACTGVLRAEVDVPPLRARVTDLTATLNPAQRDQLEAELAKLESATGSQVAVLIVPTTTPETIEQYGIRVAESWKLGRKGVDDGAVLLIAMSDRALRIEVGYGLEGVLPDAICKRIIDEIIVPRFRAGDVAGGIDAGVQAIAAAVRGEAMAQGTPWEGAGGEPAPKRKLSPDGILPLLFFGLPALAGLGSSLRRALGPLPAGAMMGGATTLFGWLFLGSLFVGAILGILVAVFVVIGGGGRPGMFLPMSRGGGGFGGGGFSGGGGGFSGGGGSFGGGGASGRW